MRERGDLRDEARHDTALAALELKRAVDSWHDRSYVEFARFAWRSLRAFTSAVRAQMGGDEGRLDA